MYYGRDGSTGAGGLWRVIWVKIDKDGPRKCFGRQSLKKLICYGLPKADHTPLIVYRLSSTIFTWSILLNTLPSVISQSTWFHWQKKIKDKFKNFLKCTAPFVFLFEGSISILCCYIVDLTSWNFFFWRVNVCHCCL